jgi:hypothetical protein
MPGFPIVRPILAKISPRPDDNFLDRKNKNCFALGQQNLGLKDYRAV